MTPFDAAFNKVVGLEGAYSNNPADPGGKTMWGITERVARVAGYQGEMKDLPLVLAKLIYHEHYWDVICGDSLPLELSDLVFSSAVNQGTYAAALHLQEALKIKTDGMIGPKTIAATKAASLGELIPRFMAKRAVGYTRGENWQTFGEGWMFRLFREMIE